MKIFDNFMTNLRIGIDYLKSDLIRNQRIFKIGFIAVYLVVFFLTLILNAIQLSSTIFIKLSEEQQGEIDLILTSYLWSQNMATKKNGFDSIFYDKKKITYSNNSNFNFSNLNFLNYYEIKEKLSNLSFIEGLSPRWFIIGSAINNDTKRNISNKFSTNILILDSLEEINIGIGRRLKLNELKNNECYISSTLSKALKVNIGDTIQLNIQMSDLLKTFLFGSKDNKNDLFENYYETHSTLYNSRNNNKPIKIRGFKGNLRDDYENIENNNTNNINSSKINFNFNLGLFDNNNTFKDLKNMFLYSEPLKKMFINIIKEYISKNIINNMKKTIDIINQFLPEIFRINNLSSIKFKKAYLFDPLIEDIPAIIALRNFLFSNDDKSEKTKSKDSKTFAYKFFKKLFAYNKENDLITIDKRIINIIDSGNVTDITNFIEDNLNYTEFLENDIKFDEYTKFLNIKLNLTIKNIILSSAGKWPSSSGNVLAIDSRYVKDYLMANIKRIIDEILNSLKIDNMEKIIWNSIHNYIKDFDIYNYSLTVNAIFKNKFEIYKKDQKSMRHYISEISNEIVDVLGSNYSVNIQTPLFQTIGGFAVLKIFLEDIFIGIMFFLWMLSILLIYSLMLGNIDERTYEFGMMRSLGIKKNNLIYLIILKGISFSIPAIIFGLLSSYVANNFVAFLFNKFTGLVMPFFMSTNNLIFGIFIGFSIPIISSYLPIKKSLQNNLRDALTLFNNKKIGDIIVSMIKLENLGISPSALVVSITLIIIGILTYYIVPLSFFLNDMSLFLFIMLSILITMLLGLLILSQLLIKSIQNIILKIIVFLSYKDRKLYLIILKNLEGHKRRNRQISIMFSIALGFVIFSCCSLNLIVDFIEQAAKSVIAGDFSIYVLSKNSPNTTLNEISINNYLKNISYNYPNIIKNYSFYSWNLEDLMSSQNIYLSSRLSSLNGYPVLNKNVYGMSDTYIESSYTSLYSVSEYNKNLNLSYTNDNKVDLLKTIYLNNNIPKVFQEKKNNLFIYPKNKNLKSIKDFQLNIIMCDGIKKYLGINLNNPARLTISPSSNLFSEHSIPCKIIGLLSKFPGVIDYSSYIRLSKYSSIYISLEQMKKLINLESDMFNINMPNLSNITTDGIRKKRMILKFKDNINKELKDMVFFGMNNYLEGLSVYSIQLDDIIKTVNDIKKVIEYIFLILGIIALILSFFLIWISFSNNIKENIAEYGIMRSIGVSKVQSIRIYLYEATAIIITSIIIGTFIGIIISTSVILQFDIFMELPFIFHFPFKLYFILITIGFSLGLLGSYYPTYTVNTLSLVKIIKGFSE